MSSYDGWPYLSLTDERGAHRTVEITGSSFTIGRLPDNDLIIDWDPEVSRAHAVLEHAGTWMLVDDQRSRNGSYVNGKRVQGRHRLTDGDRLRFGRTVVRFHAPDSPSAETAPPSDALEVAKLTDAQRRVLVALCRPMASGAIASPASNHEIAESLYISVEGVRAHLRSLFDAFRIPDLPQNRKRAELARRALNLGIVSGRDTDG